MFINKRLVARARIKQESGVVVVETAIIAGLLLFFLFASIEAARYFAAKHTLNTAAASALRVAQRSSWSTFDTRNVGRFSSEYRSFYLERNRSIFNPAKFLIHPKLMGIPPRTSFFGNLKRAVVVDRLAGRGLGFAWTTVILLRPGDSAWVSGKWADHPTVCSAFSSTCTNPIRVDQSVSELLAQEPLVVELHSEFSYIIPFFKPATISARASGFHEQPLVNASPRDFPWPNRSVAEPGLTCIPLPHEQSEICGTRDQNSRAWQYCVHRLGRRYFPSNRYRIGGGYCGCCPPYDAN